MTIMRKKRRNNLLEPIVDGLSDSSAVVRREAKTQWLTAGPTRTRDLCRLFQREHRLSTSGDIGKRVLSGCAGVPLILVFGNRGVGCARPSS